MNLRLRNRSRVVLAAIVATTLLVTGIALPGSVSAATVDKAPSGVISWDTSVVTYPHGMVADKSGRLYTANQEPGNGVVAVWSATASGVSTPERLITPPAVGAGSAATTPLGIYVADDGHIWVSYNNGYVIEYPANADGATTPLRVLTGPVGDGIQSARGVVLDSKGFIYVGSADEGTVRVFAPDADGADPYVHKLTGPDLAGTMGLAIGPNDELYVGSPAAGKVNVFAFGADGMDAPSRQISYLSAYYPAIDPVDNSLWVSSRNEMSFRHYAANANDVGPTPATPLTEVFGGATQLDNPGGVVARVTSDGKLEVIVANINSSTINRYLMGNVRATLSYSANTGTGTPPAPAQKQVGVAVKSSNGAWVTKTGHTLRRWNTKADGTGTNIGLGATFTMPSSNTRLYAQWKVKSYRLSYSANGAQSGSVPVSTVKAYGSKVTAAGNVGELAKQGYSFAGWNLRADGTGVHISAGEVFLMPAGAVRLFAQWKPGAPALPQTAGPCARPPRALSLGAPSPLLFGRCETRQTHEQIVVRTRYRPWTKGDVRLPVAVFCAVGRARMPSRSGYGLPNFRYCPTGILKVLPRAHGMVFVDWFAPARSGYRPYLQTRRYVV